MVITVLICSWLKLKVFVYVQKSSLVMLIQNDQVCVMCIGVCYVSFGIQHLLTLYTPIHITQT
jgi:hypothetical protein